MIFIAHRGNTTGPSNKENHPDYIINAINHGYNVEIDVWYVDDKIALGHDNPQYEINQKFLENINFWCHAKNLAALEMMLKNNKIHCFWHQQDDVTITSKGYVWTYPEKKLISNSIAVMTNKPDPLLTNIGKCTGICSDYIIDYEKWYTARYETYYGAL